jgi:putative endonuclease
LRGQTWWRKRRIRLPPPVSDWQVYLLRCADDSLYTGVATDLDRRLQQHNGELSGGARYTRGRRPVVLAYRENCDDRGAALRREAEIKSLTRAQKIELINRAHVVG